MTNRVAWSTNGSNVSSPYRIARYVDPQITHTPPTASTTSTDGFVVAGAGAGADARSPTECRRCGHQPHRPILVS